MYTKCTGIFMTEGIDRLGIAIINDNDVDWNAVSYTWQDENGNKHNDEGCLIGLLETEELG
jgi:hypothetical protein